ncbi:hypothetical protein SRHO_G00251430 [Serrasalmus rhombeus]
MRSQQMASPFTELENYVILFSLLVFSLFTLHGMIQERCTATTEAEDFGCYEETLVEHSAIYTVLEGNEDEDRFWTLKCVMEIPFSGLQLVFIFIAFTVFCVFSIAAVYTYTQTNNQDEKMHSDRNTTHRKSSLKWKTKSAVKTVNPDLP